MREVTKESVDMINKPLKIINLLIITFYVLFVVIDMGECKTGGRTRARRLRLYSTRDRVNYGARHKPSHGNSTADMGATNMLLVVGSGILICLHCTHMDKICFVNWFVINTRILRHSIQMISIHVLFRCLYVFVVFMLFFYLWCNWNGIYCEM